MPGRLLAVCWDMPPQSGPRAVQVSRLLRALVPLGWQSSVICFEATSARYHPDPELAARLRADAGVTLVPVRSLEESFAFRALWRVAPPVKLLPDEKWVWIRAATAAGRRLAASERFDRIVSFAQPWSDHLIGRRLHRMTGLPWIAHFSDPWVESSYLRGRRWQWRVWRRMERAVVRDATALVFVTRQTAERTMAKYPAEWRSKVHVVPHGHEGADGSTGAACAPGRPLTVVYTGRFYEGVRTPEPLLRALAAVNGRSPLADRLRVQFVGPTIDAHERLARSLGLGCVEFTGRVPHAVSDARAAAADVLLLIDAPAGESQFLPSKLVEYLPLNKPILALTPSRGASADLVRELGYPTIAPDDEAAIAAEIERLLALHAGGGLTTSAQHAAAAGRYHIREAARAFAALLDAPA